MLSNEEKKEKNVIDLLKIVNNQKCLMLNCPVARKYSKEIEELKEKKAYIDGTNVAHELCNKYWEDKIKAKIEELEKLNEEATGNGYGFAIYYLQGLLEKE